MAGFSPIAGTARLFFRQAKFQSGTNKRMDTEAG